MSINLGSAVGYLLLDSSGFSRGFQSAMQDMKNFNASTSGVSDKMVAVGNAMQSMGGTLTTSVTLPLVGLGKQILTTAMDFEKGMSAVEALTGANAKEMKELKDAAIEMGAATVYSAKDSADAMTYMGQAGWSASEIVEGLSGVMYAAAASGEDMARVSEIVTSTMSAFGIEAGKAGDVADILAVAAAESQVNINDLGESLKYAGPIAGTLGYNLQDVSIALGIMGNQGIKGSQAGTTLRRALNELNSTAGETGISMRDLGIDNDNFIHSMQNADGTMKPFMQTMFDLRESFSGLTEAQQLQAAEALFGQQAMSGMLAVINESPKKFHEMTQAVYESKDAAQNMADVMLDNAAGSIEGLMGSLETLAIQLGDIMIPIFRDIVETVNEWVDRFTELDTSTQTMILKIAGIAAAIGPVLLVFGKLTTLLGSMPNIIMGVGKAFTALLANPVLLAIAAIVAAFAYLMTTNEEFREAIISIGKNIQEAFLPVIETMRTTFDRVGESVGGIAERLAPALLTLSEAVGDVIIGLVPVVEMVITTIGELATIIIPVIETIVNAFSKLAPVIAKIVSAVATGLQPILQKIVQTLGEVITALTPIIDLIFTVVADILEQLVPVIDQVLQTVGTAITIISDLVSTIVSGLVPVLTTVIEAAKSIFDALMPIITVILEVADGIISKLQPAFASLGELFGVLAGELAPLITWLGEFVSGIVELLGPALTLMIEGIGNLIGVVIDIFTNLIDFLVSVFTGDWEGALEAISGIFVSIWEGVKANFESVLNFFGTSTEEVVNFFKDMGEGIKTWITDALTAIGTWAGDVVAKTIELGTNFINAIKEFFSQTPHEIGFAIGEALGKVGTWVVDMVTKAKELGRDFIASIVEFFQTLPGKVSGFINDALSAVGTWAGDMIAKAIETGSNFLNSIVEFFTQLPGKVLEFLTDTVKNITTFATDAANEAKRAAKEIFDNIIEGIKGIPENVKSIGKNIVEGLWNGIAGATEWIKNKVGGFARGILDGMKSSLGIRSPSTEAAILGDFFAQGFAMGFDDAADATVIDMGHALQTALDNKFKPEINTDFGIFKATDSVVKYVYTSTDAMTGLMTTAEGALTKLSENIYTLTSDITSNQYEFVQALSGSALNVVDKSKAVAEDSTSSIVGMFDKFGHEIKRVNGSIVHTFDGTYSHFRDINEVMSEINTSGSVMVKDMASSISIFFDDTETVVDKAYSGMEDITSSMLGTVGVFADGAFNIIDNATGGIQDLLSETQLAFSGMESMMYRFNESISGTFGYVFDGFGSVAHMTENISLASSAAAVGRSTATMSIADVRNDADWVEYLRQTGGGNTYIFNSPENIDAVEAVRQMKLANQEMAMR